MTHAPNCIISFAHRDLCTNRLTYICASKPSHHTWTNARLLSIYRLRTYLIEIWIKRQVIVRQKCIWMGRLQNGCHFVSASMCSRDKIICLLCLSTYIFLHFRLVMISVLGVFFSIAWSVKSFQFHFKVESQKDDIITRARKSQWVTRKSSIKAT